MAKKVKKRKQKAPQFKSAYVSVSDAELGWSGPQGGRTVTIIFRDGQGGKLGTLEISAARVRWWGAKDKLPFKVSTRDLDDMFRKWYWE